MIGLRPTLISILLVALAAVAVACGSDDPPAGPSSPETPSGSTGEPTATSHPSIPQPAPTSTASPFDGIETHPLTRLDGRIPFRPGVQPTAAPGNECEFERKTDSFPADGPRPYMEIRWNTPIAVATSDQQAFIELLSRIPDTPENRSMLTMSDYAQWRSLVGIDPVTYEDGVDAHIEQLLSVIDANATSDISEPDSNAPWPGDGPYLSGFTSYMASLETFSSLGFDGRNADQASTAGNGTKDIAEIIIGRYSPELAVELLAQCDCPQPTAVTEYGGLEYWTWSDADGQLMNLRLRFEAPVFDQLGRGGHILITEEGLYRTMSVASMETLIDTLNGTAPSLADSADFAFIADVMAANTANGVQVRSGEQFAREVVLPDGEGVIMRFTTSGGPTYTESLESSRANGLLAPLMQPFEYLAMGVGWDGAKRFDLVIMVHADEQTAIENAGRLADRLVNSNGPDGLPWATKYTAVDISVSENRLIAVFRDGTSPGYLGSSNSQILFAHEPG